MPFIKIQLNTVKRDCISSRHIPFNINRELIPLTLIPMPKPDFKVLSLKDSSLYWTWDLLVAYADRKNTQQTEISLEIC